MNITRIAILGIAAIAAITAALLMRGMLGGGTPTSQAATPPAVTTEVLVASKDIAPGQLLDVNSVRWEAWPKSAVSSAFITKEAQPDTAKSVAGIVVRSPLVSGQPITDASIVRAGTPGFMAATIKHGSRAVGVPVTAETSAGGFILPNDRVDVVLTRDVSGGNGPKDFQSQTILHDIRVLAVDQTAHQDKDHETVVGKTATLELTPGQIELVAQSQQMGVLSLALRALGDSSETAVTENVPRQPRPLPVVPSAAKNTVDVFRYGVLRSSTVGSGAPDAGSGNVASAPAATPGTSAGAPEIAGIGNPVTVSVAPAPLAMRTPQ